MKDLGGLMRIYSHANLFARDFIRTTSEVFFYGDGEAVPCAGAGRAREESQDRFTGG
jgi:hypothetical protein